LDAGGDHGRLPLQLSACRVGCIDVDAGHAVDGDALYVDAAAGADVPDVRALIGSL